MILTFKVVFQQAQERLVTLERLAPVHSWSACRFVVPTRNIHSKLQTNRINNTHRTHRGGGGENDELNRMDFMATNRTVQRTLTEETVSGRIVSHCGKVCKSQRGMKIHQTKSGADLQAR